MKVQEGSVIKHLNFRICQYTIDFSIDQTEHTMELINEWFPTVKFRKVDTPFRTDSSYEKELLAVISLTWHALHKEEIEYHGEVGHTLRRIQHIALVSRIGLCYATCCLSTQTVAPTLPGFQGINRCVQYLASHPHKKYFICLILMMDQMSSGLHGVEIKLNTT